MTKGATLRILVSAAAVVALVILPIMVEPARLLYAVVFCLLVPGCGWAYRAPVGDTVDRIAVAVTISMSATILVATAMVVTNSWSASGGVAVLAAFAALGFAPFGRTPRSDHRRGAVDPRSPAD